MDDRRQFVRFRGVARNRRGFRPGVFALVNGLHFDGVLSPAESRYRRQWNAWFERHLPDPTRASTAAYDDGVNPGAVAWFRLSAHGFLAPIPGYLRILDAHGIAHEAALTTRPGRVVYEDEHQVVAVGPDHAHSSAEVAS